jgi:hypothetical protein
MKTNAFFKLTAVMAVIAMTVISCGTSKKTVQTAQTLPVETYTPPCWQPDDADFYRGTVSRRASVNSMNTLATACLRAARQNLQQKIKGTLKQVTRDYFDQMDVDEGSTVASHIESASDYIVDQYMNDMLETCRQVTLPDAQGMVTMYISVEISKKDLVDNLAKGLSTDEQTKLRFDEKTFRDDAMKVFSKDRQESYDDFSNSRAQ